MEANKEKYVKSYNEEGAETETGQQRPDLGWAGRWNSTLKKWHLLCHV